MGDTYFFHGAERGAGVWELAIHIEQLMRYFFVVFWI